MSLTHWQRDLEALEREGLRRQLRTVDGPQGARVVVDGREVLLLCSNDYLGLAVHPALIEAAREATSRYGAGSGASRLVSGSMRTHVRLEERLAEFKGTTGALLFNSGYAANTGIIQGLFGPDDVIFSDELNHASIIDGCRLSRARTVVYPHGDAGALEALMKAESLRRKGRWLLVTDGVFSMDGDLAPLPELCRLRDRFDALLMVDDAHGTGVLGTGGRGTAEHFGCLDRIDLHMGTLGKALGCAGAFLCADRILTDTLVNRSRSFIFSTSLPPAVPASALAAIDLVTGDEGRRLREQLQLNRECFRQRLVAAGVDTMGSMTQIVPLLVGDADATMAATGRLLDRGLFLQGIRPPTVPPGSCRLRATVMAVHQPEELETAARIIIEELAR